MFNRLALLLLSLLGSMVGLAQQKHAPIDPASHEVFFSLDSVVDIYVDRTDNPSFLAISPEQFPGSAGRSDSPADLIVPRYLSFTLRNNKAIQLYFFAEENTVVRVCQTDVNGNCVAELKAIPFRTSASVFHLFIPPDSTCRFVARIRATAMDPALHSWLIHDGQLDNFFLYYKGYLEASISLFCVMAGMLFMMFLYIASKYVQLRSAEYGYYAAYILFMLGYVALRTLALVELNLVPTLGTWYLFFNNQLQVVAYCMYFPFLTAFLNTREKNPTLHRFLLRLPILLIVYIAADSALIAFDKVELHTMLWNALRAALLLLVLYIAIRVSRMKTPYGIYPIIGGLALDFFALTAMILSIHPDWIETFFYPFYYPVFYYFVGISIELLFFSLGLGLKNRSDEIEKVEAQDALKLAAERQKFEQYKTIMDVQEAERARIAKDLHDGIGGMLSGIKISLVNLLPHLGMGEKEKLQYERSVDLLDSSVQELRKVSHNMMPASLAEFGVVAALRDYCESVKSMQIVDVLVQSMGTEVRQPTSREIVIYRIVQELINNIVKHAQARQALAQLSFDRTTLAITVEDDGNGFDISKMDEFKSSGWKNIRSRVDFLQGIVDIRSGPSGTSVHIQIPVMLIP